MSINVEQRYETARDVSRNNKVPAIILETSGECPLACKRCYMITGDRTASLSGKPQMIDSRKAVEIFDLIKAQNSGQEAQSVDLVGGEPMLPRVWQEVKKTIEIASDRGIVPWLFTNGMFMTPEDAKWLLDKKTFITMKLNIGNPNDPKQMELQAKMVGRNINAAKQLARGLYIALDAGLKNPQLSVENLIRAENAPLVGEFYELGLKLGFKPDVEITGNGQKDNWGFFAEAPSIEQIRSIMGQIKSVREKQGLEPITFLMPHITGSCSFFDTALYFRPNGDIQPCSGNPTVLANVNQENAIGNAIESPVIQVRRNLTQSQLSGPCGNCGTWSLCRGGCRATVESFGNPYGSYPLCGIQKEFNNAKDIALSNKK
ncbi:MAG: SPASM domain-containing protein [Candidatus Gottesmanbacteria bacterium]